jgi:hypothetical protein
MNQHERLWYGLRAYLTALMAATSRVVVGFFIDRLDQRIVGAKWFWCGFRPYQTALVACITLPQQVTSLIITADEKSGSHLGGQPKAVKSNSTMLRPRPKRSVVGLL